jgi:hypothetical protein
MEAHNKRRHVRRGRRKGAPPANSHALQHGRASRLVLEHRKALMELLRACREAMREPVS